PFMTDATWHVYVGVTGFDRPNSDNKVWTKRASAGSPMGIAGRRSGRVEGVLPVVLLSHRGPVSFRRTASGLAVKRSAGGLVTALMGLAEHLDEAVWVCA